MCTILLSVTCDQLTYNTRVFTSIHSLIIIISVYVCRLLCCNDIKERCFILTVQTYNGYFRYTNKIDEMHKYSLKCNFTLFIVLRILVK